MVKQESIVAKADEQEVKIAAAIEIQRVWRGYHTRLVGKDLPRHCGYTSENFFSLTYTWSKN